MRKLLQELYECERMMKLAAKPAMPSSMASNPDSGEPDAPLKTSGNPPAVNTPKGPAGTAVQPTQPAYLTRDGVSRSVPITDEMRKIIPWAENATHLQHMADKNGVFWLEVPEMKEDGTGYTTRYMLSTDSRDPSLMQLMLPSEGSVSGRLLTDKPDPSKTWQMTYSPHGIQRVTRHGEEPLEIVHTNPAGEFRRWEPGELPPAGTATVVPAPAEDTAGSAGPSETPAASQEPTTPSTAEDPEAARRAAYIKDHGERPEWTKETPAESIWSDPTFQSNALTGLGVGLLGGLGGYALTGGRGGLAPWLMLGGGVGAGIGGLSGYNQWNTNKTEYDDFLKKQKAWDEGLDLFEPDPWKQTAETPTDESTEPTARIINSIQLNGHPLVVDPEKGIGGPTGRTIVDENGVEKPEYVYLSEEFPRASISNEPAFTTAENVPVYTVQQGQDTLYADPSGTLYEDPDQIHRLSDVIPLLQQTGYTLPQGAKAPANSLRFLTPADEWDLGPYGTEHYLYSYQPKNGPAYTIAAYPKKGAGTNNWRDYTWYKYGPRADGSKEYWFKEEISLPDMQKIINGKKSLPTDSTSIFDPSNAAEYDRIHRLRYNGYWG